MGVTCYLQPKTPNILCHHLNLFPWIEYNICLSFLGIRIRSSFFSLLFSSWRRQWNNCKLQQWKLTSLGFLLTGRRLKKLYWAVSHGRLCPSSLDVLDMHPCIHNSDTCLIFDDAILLSNNNNKTSGFFNDSIASCKLNCNSFYFQNTTTYISYFKIIILYTCLRISSLSSFRTGYYIWVLIRLHVHQITLVL